MDKNDSYACFIIFSEKIGFDHSTTCIEKFLCRKKNYYITIFHNKIFFLRLQTNKTSKEGKKSFHFENKVNEMATTSDVLVLEFMGF